MKLVIIAAVAKNGVIGKASGEMPWHSKEEFQHFRNTTLGYPIIMGRKTFESLEKPLKGRLNIILTKKNDLNYNFDEIKIMNSLNEAYDFCREKNYEKAFVIGGGKIFEKAIDDVDEMIISIMNFEAEGEVYFPEIKDDKWRLESTEERSEFEIRKYVKKNGKN